MHHNFARTQVDDATVIVNRSGKWITAPRAPLFKTMTLNLDVACEFRHGIAASYEFSEALERFVLDIERAKRVMPIPPTAPE